MKGHIFSMLKKILWPIGVFGSCLYFILRALQIIPGMGTKAETLDFIIALVFLILMIPHATKHLFQPM